jgi:Tn3 transposase DDE domain
LLLPGWIISRLPRVFQARLARTPTPVAVAGPYRGALQRAKCNGGMGEGAVAGCNGIRQQYDQMVKYVTAVRLGTAETESILRRFVRSNVQHPTYKAFSELGKAVKTIFLCQYLHSGCWRGRNGQKDSPPGISAP